jgi:hypothetical protein
LGAIRSTLGAGADAAEAALACDDEDGGGGAATACLDALGVGATAFDDDPTFGGMGISTRVIGIAGPKMR